MTFYISSPNPKRHGMEYKSVAYYRLDSKGYKNDLKTDSWKKEEELKERKRVLNPLTNREICVGDGPFMEPVQTRYMNGYNHNWNQNWILRMMCIAFD